MPPTLGDRLIHIIETIDDIGTFLAGYTAESLAADLPRRLATERAFEIICEASRYVPPEIRAREPGIDWRGMTDLGNLLRHAYHRVDVNRLLTITKHDLPPLRVFVEKVLRDEQGK